MQDGDAKDAGSAADARRESRRADNGQPEPSHGLKRRDILKAMSAVSAAALVPLSPSVAETVAEKQQSGPGGHATSAKGVYKPQVLNDHEWKTVCLLSDIIVPADERSGSATQAGVPEFIDDWLGFRGGEALSQVRGGLVWLDMVCNREFHRDFLDCSSQQQKQILDRIAYPKTAAPEDAAGVAFFNKMRDLVVSGFFSSEMGVKDLPYVGNQMLSHWDGCPANVVARLGLKNAGEE
jgi:gluconate 2-dehydrogenase gamma chain